MGFSHASLDVHLSTILIAPTTTFSVLEVFVFRISYLNCYLVELKNLLRDDVGVLSLPYFLEVGRYSQVQNLFLYQVNRR